ncbi:MAG: hypothetical protein KDA47_08680, partial [Planctomycetales bacterium]|nr:hypothetical protein [Planctomycetales bacterium]
MTSVDVHDVANSGEPIGLLAGWGRLPIQVARTLKHEGHRVFCLGIKDHADAALAD